MSHAGLRIGAGIDTGAGKRLVVAAAIVDNLARPTRVLAARRSQPARIAGLWEFPGGKVEVGEDPAAALHRELREELGVEVELGALIPRPWLTGSGGHSGGHRKPGGCSPEGGGSESCDSEGGNIADWDITDRHVMRLWFARIVEGVPQPLVEHDALRWLAVNQLTDLPWLPGDLPILASLTGLMYSA